MAQQLVGEKEVRIVDGGSTDGTVALAKKYGDVIVIAGAKGRANQMNIGAKEASGDVLLFLHCDSMLRPDSLLAIERAFKDKSIVGGCFTLEMDDSQIIFKLICLGSNIRARLSKVFFGDQGIFVKRSVFNELGGFPSIDIMEDWEFSKTLNKKGKVVQLPEKIITSARRFKKSGALKTCLFMHKLKIQYFLGKTPAELKKKYYDVR